ncbi:cAMP-regulated phosphoprotein 21-like protein [Dinothrombium tinctorium]|uniref:cAMP-regulated phosphoprotein 21-like protein n=1 Tax=Dinothrombium tinctorium TaxID=1965070 RepID=A0A3S3P499_9ACAR|nr:cAMP-regulated phosphoprotein 21-like protein [Dinothrombium tinctorium]
MESSVKDERMKDNQHQTRSQRRLSKQEEVDFGNDTNFNGRNQVIADNGCIVPVTIHVEDRGDVYSEADHVYKSGKRLQNLEDCYVQESDYSSSMHLETSRQSVSFENQLGSNGETAGDKDKKRSKVLTRSKALSDDASPPPDVDALKLNANRLSVHSSSLQSQKSGSQGSSQGSQDGSSPSLSRGKEFILKQSLHHVLFIDSSTETYTDSTGTDLQQFLLDTLQNPKDRIHLLKIEQDLIALVKDNDRQYHKFPQMSSYHRMLVHRVAAFFGMEHNVDTNGNAVIVNKSKSTRLPDMKFRDYAKDGLTEEPKKLILKRDSASLEENSGQSGSNSKEKSPDRKGGNSGLNDTRRSKSFEEREEQYEKARARIFNQGSSSSTSEAAETNTGQTSSDECFGVTCDGERKPSSPQSSQDEAKSNWNAENRQWSSTDSDCSGRPNCLQLQKQNRLVNSLDSDSTKNSITTSSSMSSSSGMFLTPDSCLSERVLACNQESKPSVTKASSFGGMTGLNYENNLNSNSKSRLTKAGSFNVPRTSDTNFNNSTSFNPMIQSEFKQTNNQTQSQPVSAQLQQSSHIHAPASHSSGAMQRKQWTGSAPPMSQSMHQPHSQPNQPQQQQQPQHIQQQQPVPILPPWQGFNPNNSMLVFGGTMADHPISDNEKQQIQLSQPFLTPMGGYIPPQSNGEQPINVYRNIGNPDPQKAGLQSMIPSGAAGPALVYIPCVPQQQQFQPPSNVKHMNSNNGSSKAMNQNRNLNVQFSAMSINQNPREAQNRNDNSASYKDYQKQYMLSGNGPRPNILPPQPAANGQIPMCFIQNMHPQSVSAGTVPMNANPATVSHEFIYANPLQSNLLVLNSQVGSNPGVANQFQNSIPVQLPIPYPIPSQSTVPPPQPPSQSQVLRNSVQQPVQYPVPYQIVNQIQPNTSQVGTSNYPYGTHAKPQVSPCLPVYVLNNANNVSGNQATGMRPMTQTGPLLPTPYAQRSSMFRTPSPPQSAPTPPLAMSTSGPSQYLGYTICTPPPSCASAPAVNNTAINQNAAAINAATQTFMSMLRAQAVAAAAAVASPTGLGNQMSQSGVNKRFPAPTKQIIPNQNSVIQRYPELPEFQGSSNNNKFVGSCLVGSQPNMLNGNNVTSFYRRLPAPLPNHAIDIRLINPSSGAIIGQQPFLIANNTQKLSMQGSSNAYNRQKPRRPKNKAFHSSAYSSGSADTLSSSKNNLENRKFNSETSGVFNSVACGSSTQNEDEEVVSLFKYEVKGLPQNILKCELESSLKPLFAFGAVIEIFENERSEEPLNAADEDVIEVGTRHRVLVSFVNETVAQQAVDSVKSLNFELFPTDIQIDRTDSSCVTNNKNVN